MLGVHVRVRVHFLPMSMSMFMPTFIFTLMFMGHEVENFKLFRIFAAAQKLPIQFHLKLYAIILAEAKWYTIENP
jgi:hypothetical protein